MDTALSEDQQLMANAIKDLLDREVTFDRARELEASGGYDEPLWRKLASLGWLGLPFPESAGGGGGALVDAAIVTEALARHAAMVPYAPVMAAGMAIASSEDLASSVGDILSGEAIVVPAMLDASDDVSAAGGALAADGTFTGERMFVEYGQHATAFLAAAGADLWLLANDPGTVSVRALPNIARTPLAAVTFRRARTSHAAPAGGMERLIDRGRALAAAECLGIAQQALDMTVEYVKNRVQFGRPIGTFQAVQHHCANMATMAEAMRFLVYEAAWALDAGVETPGQVALAKAWASEAVVEITALAYQLHGGVGVTEEYNLHFFGRRAKERASAWGTPSECLAVAAGTIDIQPEWA